MFHVGIFLIQMFMAVIIRFSFPILSLEPGFSVAKWRLFLCCAPVPTLHPGVAGGRGELIGSELSS